MSWCRVWHLIHGSLSWLPAYPGASYAETSLPEYVVGLLVFICQQMRTVISCMQAFHFHLPVCAEFYHRTHLESKLVSVSTRLQYKFSPPSQQPRSCSLSIHLFLPVFQNRNALTCHCTSKSVHWNCSWKGVWWPCPKQYKDFGFYCWRGKTTNFFILVLEHSPVVLSRLWSLRLNSTHAYTCVCVCVCACACICIKIFGGFLHFKRSEPMFVFILLALI